MIAVASILLATALVWFTSIALGRLLMLRTRVALSPSERCYLTFLIGSGGLSLLVFGLTVVRLAYWQAFLSLALAILAIERRQQRQQSTFSLVPVPLRWLAVFCVVYFIFGVYYLGVALAPEVSSDGTAYHVGWIARYFDHHGFLPVTTNFYASLPAGAEMLYLFAFAFGRHSAAAMVHFLFLLMLPIAILNFGRRLGQPAGGVVAGLLFYTAPVVGKSGTSAYNDVAAAAVCFGVFLLLELWRESGDRSLLPLAGFVAGFAFAVKYSTAIAIPFAVCWVVFVSWRRMEGPFRAGGVVLVAAMISVAPWAAKNFIVIGNPFHPFFNRYFPNSNFYESVEDAYRRNMAAFSGVTWPEIPLEVTVRGERVQGIVGPVFLLAPLSLLGLADAARRRLLFAFGVFALPYGANILARFLIPSLPFLCLGLALAFTRRPGLCLSLVTVQALLSFPPIVGSYAPRMSRLDMSPWRAALRLMPEADFLGSHFSEYRTGLMLDRYVSHGEKVLTTSFGQLAYHHQDMLGSYTSSMGQHAVDTIVGVLTPNRQPTWFRDIAFLPVRSEGIRVIASNAEEFEWMIHELRIYNGNRELPRSSAWTLAVPANPWELGLAFDNSRVSWWRSGRAVQPGMFVEVVWEKSEEVSRVRMEHPRFQSRLQICVEARLDGQWHRMATTEKQFEVPPPPRMRRAVSNELKAVGIRWLLWRRPDYVGEDLIAKAPLWGARIIGESDGFVLLRLD